MKVGKYDIPDMRLHPKLFDATKRIYEKFKSEEATNQLTVAKLIGHKSVSGSFFTKLACLRAYGLVEKRGIKVTDVGKRLTYGATDEERNNALKEAILNIPLWQEFYSRWGVTLPTVDFWVDLGKITGLEAPDAQRTEEIVRNAYLNDARYIKEAKKPEGDVSGMGAEGKVDTSMAIIEVKVGGYYQKLPYTEEGIKLAKGFLDLLENQLKAKAKPKENTPEEEG